MHAYGKDGLVILGYSNGFELRKLTTEEAGRLLKQLPVAIHEAELQAIGQTQLFTSAASVESGTL